MHITSLSVIVLISIAMKARGGSSPGPLVIPASEHFEGNDGPWSTFDIRVGEPEQHVRVLVSTASPQSMVVSSDLGCSGDVFSNIPSGCAKSRGSLFNISQSSSWHDVGTYGINENGLGFEANLGYKVRAQWGLEKLGIGLTGPQLENQTVATIAAAEPLYLGLFGLNNQPVNFSDLGNSSSPAFLAVLKDNDMIPSLSWSYTAGAKYRLKQVYGQLIFSGYDQSRFTENSVTFSMADDQTRDLVVGLQSISYSGSTSMTLLSDGIDIFIDSTDPNMWLPRDVCEAFEKAFDLQLDNETGLYLVDETHRNRLLDTDAEVTFRLSDDRGGGDTVSITLPYAAFDLKADSPLVENSSHYFPLRRAENSTQYTLGRVFLQEAYLSADYERKVFNVSSCKWESGAVGDVVMITSKDAPDDRQGSGGGDGSGLSGGEIAGIVVGAVGGFLLLLAMAVCMFLRHRRRSKERAYQVTNILPNPDVTMVGGPAHNSDVPFSSADISGWSPSSISPRGQLGQASIANTETPPELDGRQTRQGPRAEIVGKEMSQAKHPFAQNPGVYELPGSKVAESCVRRQNITPASASPSETSHNVSDESPPSPLASTAGTTWAADGRPVSELASPLNQHSQRR